MNRSKPPLRRFAALLVVPLLQPASAATFHVDLSPVANISREDDGIAGNGKGGWTDEGINDLYLHPALPVGETTRNGFAFSLLDPGPDGLKPAALMLRVGAHQTNRPKTARVDVPNVLGAYVAFVHHSIGGSQAKEGDVTAVYTIHYADGQSVEAPMKKGVHLRDWWCRQWWDNSGRDAWPVHMGRNVYTMKWRSLIGLWATQWKNPRPDVPIAGITFASLDRGGPVIWAVTITDDDPHADESRIKSNAWATPPPPPAGWFEKKHAAERAAIYAAAVADGHVEGVRAIDLIRADLLAVTVDPALTRTAAGPNPAADAVAQRPETFRIFSADDPGYGKGAQPVKVGRDSYEYWNGDIGPYKQNSIYWHTFYLQLPRPLKSGATYSVRVDGVDPAMRDTLAFAYREADAATPAIKVNQVAYSPLAKRRYAYLGWWAGDLGAVDYGALERFEVVDEATGKTVLSGALADRPDPAGNTGEIVREMDLAALKTGRYHVRIPGLGRSASFAVGGEPVRDLYVHTQRAFYHQRCGFPLQKPFTTFEKPACHLWVYESGKMAEEASYRPETGEAKREYRGGYHDAADFDCFTYHLRATAENLDAFDMRPAAFKDGDLNIPESGNGIPDLLDEAEWALRFWREQQTADGAVPKGRCNDQDSRRQNHVKWGPFGIFEPDPESNLEYAATAASFARLYAKHDDALAKRYLDSAALAYDWAVKQPADPKAESHSSFLLWAAGALYRATGDARYQDAILRLDAEGIRVHWKTAHHSPLFRWPYLRCTLPGVKAGIQQKFRDEIIRAADEQLDKRLDGDAYRWGGDSARGMGWGNANGGGHHADVLLRAWWLTGEQKYLDGASLNADFQLGCNPLSKTFITGMGARPPLHPQISAFLYEKPGKRGGTVQGITIYGLTDRDPAGWHPAERPRLRRWRDLGNGGAEISSEFTITETIGASAMLYATFHALVSEGARE